MIKRERTSVKPIAVSLWSHHERDSDTLCRVQRWVIAPIPLEAAQSAASSPKVTLLPTTAALISNIVESTRVNAEPAVPGSGS